MNVPKIKLERVVLDLSFVLGQVIGLSYFDGNVISESSKKEIINSLKQITSHLEDIIDG